MLFSVSTIWSSMKSTNTKSMSVSSEMPSNAVPLTVTFDWMKSGSS